MIVVADFGSQSTHLIVRRLRDIGIATKLVEPERLGDHLNEAKGIILSGGPSSVYAEGSPSLTIDLAQVKVPILGVCYGWQLIAHLLGGSVTSTDKEYGPVKLEVTQECKLFSGIKDRQITVYMSHGDEVKQLPSGFTSVATTQKLANAAACNTQQQIYGLQFHPELTHTDHGSLILENFAQKICGLSGERRVVDVNEVIAKVKKQLEKTEGMIVAAISGGVDSTVASAIVAKAVGDRLKPIYCNNGLMRLGTAEQVKRIFKDHLKIDPIILDCQELFLEKLKGETSPEGKRKVIGNLYIELFEQEANKFKKVKYLVQGTIYSDVIESKGSKHAAKIKSHHNVGGLPEKMNLQLIEPLRDYYKDEVLELGRQLGLPDEAVRAQPFPGPGHAIRILGEVTAKRLTKQQQADAIVVEVLKQTGYYDEVFQCFPVMTGVNTTAVKGDGRAFAELVGLRIYGSSDIMSANWSRIPYDVLEMISTRIVNEVSDVSRVVYDITTKPPATMEWE